jgi:CO/xanthine dehydrogenase FAD-binding subunit
VLDLDGDVISWARVAVGSAAMKPWRLERTEQLLAGVRLGSQKDPGGSVTADHHPVRAAKATAVLIKRCRTMLTEPCRYITRQRGR